MSGEKSHVQGDSPLGDRDAFSHTTTSPNGSERPLFTPGEWRALCVGSGGDYDNPVDVYEVTNGYARIAEYVSERDAHLIAAAKDLFAALQDVIGWIPMGGWHTEAPMESLARARSALSKARGEQ